MYRLLSPLSVSLQAFVFVICGWWWHSWVFKYIHLWRLGKFVHLSANVCSSLIYFAQVNIIANEWFLFLVVRCLMEQLTPWECNTFCCARVYSIFLILYHNVRGAFWFVESSVFSWIASSHAEVYKKRKSCLPIAGTAHKSSIGIVKCYRWRASYSCKDTNQNKWMLSAYCVSLLLSIKRAESSN